MPSGTFFAQLQSPAEGLFHLFLVSSEEDMLALPPGGPGVCGLAGLRPSHDSDAFASRTHDGVEVRGTKCTGNETLKLVNTEVYILCKGCTFTLF